jgi:glycogen operon protein
VRDFLAIEMLSLGVPMLLMGDEVRRTQGGNNNDYCHDDATAWFDWTGPDRHADVLRFTRGLIRLRRRLSDLMEVPEGTSLLDLLQGASTEWSGVTLGEPDLAESSHSIALTVRAPAGALHLILNAYWEPLDFELPVTDAATGSWRRIIDTGMASPADIALDFVGAAIVDSPTLRAEARSVVLLASRRTPASTRSRSPR